MAGFLDALIQEGPYRGFTIGECIAFGFPPIEANSDHAELRRFVLARIQMKDATQVREELFKNPLRLGNVVRSGQDQST